MMPLQIEPGWPSPIGRLSLRVTEEFCSLTNGSRSSEFRRPNKHRKEVDLNTLTKTLLLATFATTSSLQVQAASGDKVISVAKAVEKALEGRVGVFVVDTRDGTTWSYRGDERFPMASTFKTLACGALLASGALNAVVTIDQRELVTYSPVTEKLVGQKTPVLELCAATLRTSDNTAANKVLDVLGGPQKVTDFLRMIGDVETRLDRREPELNEGAPGDDRDTTTPAAMASTMKKLVLGDALEDHKREQLTAWLTANEVGGPLLRAGVPDDWQVADRTGAGGFGTRGVAAVMWPPERQPLVATVYVTGTDASMEDRNNAIADIARAIAAEISK
jgi:beta-lactamase class A/beta-lactamase class A CARB-5